MWVEISTCSNSISERNGPTDLKCFFSVYVGEDQIEEPAFDYLPETHQITTPGGANALEASLLLLQESLESGAALAQFEVRKNLLMVNTQNITYNTAEIKLSVMFNGNKP